MADYSRDDALRAVTQIYADVGHVLDSGDINDMDNRIRNGQTLAELVANTYDQAQARFKVPDTPQTRAEEAAGLRPTYDAQLETGRHFDPPAVMLEQLAAPAREQAPMMAGTQSVFQQSPPTNTPRYNIGPAPANFGGGAMMASGSALGGGSMLGGLSLGTILLLGGGAILAVVLFRKMGKRR